MIYMIYMIYIYLATRKRLAIAKNTVSPAIANLLAKHVACASFSLIISSNQVVNTRIINITNNMSAGIGLETSTKNH